MRRRNDWDVREPADEERMGRAVITMGLVAGDVRFSRGAVVQVVAERADASIQFQVGTTRAWGREPSVSIVLLNLAPRGVPLLRFTAFVHRARLLTAELASAFAQEVVILETQSASGAYRHLVYRNDLVAQERRVLRTALASRGRVGVVRRPRRP